MLICSYPKSGRTWLRYMLAQVLVQHFGLALKLDLKNMFRVLPNDDCDVVKGWPAYRYYGTLPSIAASHELYSRRLHRGHRIVFIVRDPRDVMVSYWFHQAKHLGHFDGSISKFLYHPKYGIEPMLTYLESWAAAAGRERLLAVSYEQMHADPIDVLERVCTFFGIQPSADELREAVTAGQFRHMREMELANGIGGHAYDRADESALRMRVGRTGEFGNYLGTSDAAKIRDHVTRASPQLRQMLRETGYLK